MSDDFGKHLAPQKIREAVTVLTGATNCDCGKPATLWINAAPHAASGGSMVPKCSECSPYKITVDYRPAPGV